VLKNQHLLTVYEKAPRNLEVPKKPAGDRFPVSKLLCAAYNNFRMCYLGCRKSLGQLLRVRTWSFPGDALAVDLSGLDRYFAACHLPAMAATKARWLVRVQRVGAHEGTGLQDGHNGRRSRSRSGATGCRYCRIEAHSAVLADLNRLHN
jgi:hypothetical protein